MRRQEVIFIAVMSTIIAHLIVAIIFMSLKISALKDRTAQEVYIEIERDVEDLPEKDLSQMTEDEMLKYATAEQIVNIAKNVADKPIDIDPAEYQDMVKEELIKSGMLNESNFIDEQKKAEASSEDEISVNNEEKKALDVIKEKETEKNVTFKGLTRIFYDLTRRHHTYLPIPIYKCEGAGQVTLSIEVDQSGNVIKATPASQLSTTSDECLTETAVTYALKARFNSDKSAPTIQKGFLTFVFVSQKR